MRIWRKSENVKKNIEKLDFVTGFATSQRGNGDTHLKCFSPIWHIWNVTFDSQNSKTFSRDLFLDTQERCKGTYSIFIARQLALCHHHQHHHHNQNYHHNQNHQYDPHHYFQRDRAAIPSEFGEEDKQWICIDGLTGPTQHHLLLKILHILHWWTHPTHWTLPTT